jgi:hypothetical protein
VIDSVEQLIRSHRRDEIGAEDELVRRLKSGPSWQETEEQILALVGREDVDWQIGLSALVLANQTHAVKRLAEIMGSSSNVEVKDKVAVTLGRLRGTAHRDVIAMQAASAVEQRRMDALRLVGALARVDVDAAISLAAQWLVDQQSSVFSREETAIEPLLNWLWEADPGSPARLSATLKQFDGWPTERWTDAALRWARKTGSGAAG